MRRVVQAVFGATLIGCLAFTARAQTPVPVTWSIAPLPTTASSGKPVDATITAVIDEGWKVYSLTQAPGGPVALVIGLSKNTPFTAAGAASGPLPHTSFDPNFNFDTEYYEGKADFTVPVKYTGKPAAGGALRVAVTYQTCNQRLCLPPTDIELTTPLAKSRTSAEAGATPEPATPAPSLPGNDKTDDAASVGGSGAREPDSIVVPDLSSRPASTLSAYIGLAALMGGLSLLTPCVFPMVPITVSFFTNRARRGGAVRDAMVYGLGIVLTFTAVGFTLAVGFGAAGLNRFAANPWLNLGVTALFIAFALSLFGVWNMALPARLVNAMARADEGRGRWAGTLLMGLAFTLTSFTCTAPFLGTLLVVASQGDWLWPFTGMLTFAAVFAAPFVGLALAPRWLASLPRSGPWLVAVKTVMGLLELAAAFKFLSNADLIWGWQIFTRETVIVAWIAIAIVLAVYLAGLTRLGPSPKLGRLGPGRLVATTVAVLLGVWLASGLAGRRLGELEAFLPPADLAAVARDGELSWVLNDYDTALADAARQNRPLLVDFTGYTCTNCRWMEANMFPRPEVAEELARYVRVRLYTDGRDASNQRFQRMEQQMFGTVALPYYAVIAPNGRPKVAFGGLTRDPGEFVAFLQQGLR